MHPVANIRGSRSQELAGRRIVLAVSGSIAAVKTVELARELIRHGAEVHPVMSEAATRILHPDALEFACGRRPVVRLSGQVEHVGLLGDVPGRADLLLLAPATANTIAKVALGIDDSVVTTCASVALGTRVPIVVAPAMHEAMMRHATIQAHIDMLRRNGVAWVEPRLEEHKAKLAEPESIVEAVIARLAQRDGPLRGKRCLVVSGATAERVDDVRVLTNRSSGRTGYALVRALRRLGAEVTLWQGHATEPVPDPMQDALRFSSHKDLMALAQSLAPGSFHQVWMPAAVSDYVPLPSPGKIPSGQDELALVLRPVSKIAATVRRQLPDAKLVLFKAEATTDGLEDAARRRMREHGADYVAANTVAGFGAADNVVLWVPRDGDAETISGTKESIMAKLAHKVAA